MALHIAKVKILLKISLLLGTVGAAIFTALHFIDDIRRGAALIFEIAFLLSLLIFLKERRQATTDDF